MSGTHSAAIEQQVHHLGNEVNTLNQSQAAIQATQRYQGAQIDKLADGVEKILDAISAPKPQVQLWTVLGGIATLLGSMVLFVELRLAPYEVSLAKIADATAANSSQIVGRAEFVGAAKEKLLWIDSEIKHLHERSHIENERLSKVEAQAAAAEVSRRAIGDYLEQVDQHGSRFWLDKKVPERTEPAR